MIIRTSVLAITLLTLTSGCAVAATPPPPAVAAQTIPAAASLQPSAALTQRAADIVKLINGQMQPSQLFATSLLAQITPDQISGLARTIRTRRGAAIGVDRIEVLSANAGKVHVLFDGGVLPISIVLDAAEPNLIRGLQL